MLRANHPSAEPSDVVAGSTLVWDAEGLQVSHFEWFLPIDGTVRTICQPECLPVSMMTLFNCQSADTIYIGLSRC